QTITLSAQPRRSAKAHCAAYVAAKNWVLVTDLGDDKVKVFIRAANGSLTYQPEADVSFPEGEGPRHIALHPNGQLAVVNGEMIGRIHLIDLSGDRPEITNVANTLPERVIDEASGAAIRLGANGKMVYTSERNFSVVTALRIDEKDQKLVVRDTYPSGGEAPRDLSLAPKGEWLLTANTLDSTVGVFRIGPKGGLAHYHTFKKVPSPTSLAWL
ncbi:MAG: beta-propeller fold lactonase family protein, partial [Bacteroidota bacterium]